MRSHRVVCVVGARPNFVKMASVLRAMERRKNAFAATLVHTGQHTGQAMCESICRDVGLRRPDIHLRINRGGIFRQMGSIICAFGRVVQEQKPHAVLVVGDVTSTAACGIAAKHCGVKLIHVEAGLRSHNRSMPEEINRVLTDSVSDILFCSEQSGVDNLREEGIKNGVYLIGNVMIDTLIRCRLEAFNRPLLPKAIRGGAYAVLTLHRPSNVESPEKLVRFMQVIRRLLRDMPLVFPVHPRTRKALEGARLGRLSGLFLLPPMGYLDFLNLEAHARIVLTDSGGVQEETSALGVPCLTLRNETERPCTLECMNWVVGTRPSGICKAIEQRLAAPIERKSLPPLWDGRAAERIADVLEERL